MTRWIILIVAVIVLTAAATFMAQDATNSEAGPNPLAVNSRKGPQPKLEIGQPLVYDFGSMSRMRKGAHTWEIKNSGEGELEMWMESSSCSCTIAKLATTGGEGKEKPHVHVKPNATTTIDLEWDTKTFPETAYHKNATIGTNDPTRPSFQLHVKGNVYPPVSVFPQEMVTMNGISNEEMTRATIAVYSMDMPTMKITKITTSRPEFIVAKYEPMTTESRQQLKVPGGGYRVDLEVKPGLPVGRFSDDVLIETDHALQKEVKVSIAGYATGPISIVPDRVRMTSVSSTQGGTLNLNLVVRGGKATVFEVVHKPEKIDVTIESNETPTQKGRHRLTVSVPPGTPSGPIEDEIVIKTDHPRAAEMRIPVMILITKSSDG